jgi:homocysteine S-methyltransferase
MQPPTDNPITAFVKHQGAMILDGGLATALEARGYDLDDDLWSAKILLDDPDAIRQVHMDFLAAGADCIATASYQASLPGFCKRGLSDGEGIELLRRSVTLAVGARDTFWNDPANQQGRLRPLVAASVGPYGAYLADGSEYTGRYNIDDEGLREFHRERWHILAGSEADLLACETIPSRQEARVLTKLLKETPDRWVWMSFSCRNESELSDGNRLANVVRNYDGEPNVAAIGINCTAPEFVSSLITEVRKETKKPVIVYPNSGERYDSDQKAWVGTRPTVDWEKASAEWARLGATGIGGCCRVGPQEIATVRRQLIM